MTDKPEPDPDDTDRHITAWAYNRLYWPRTETPPDIGSFHQIGPFGLLCAILAVVGASLVAYVLIRLLELVV